MRHGLGSDHRERLLRELACSPSIVSVWDFYCPTGSIIRDRVGVNHITLSGSPVRGGAFTSRSFIGNGWLTYPTTSDFGTAADHASLDLGDGPFTLAGWGTRDTNESTETWLNKGANGYGMGVGTPDEFMLYKTGVGLLFRASVDMDADGFVYDHFITRTGTGTGNTLLYRNGDVGTIETDTATALANTALGLEFGREGAVQRWTGKQSITAIWSRKLAASEIRYWHLVGLGG